MLRDQNSMNFDQWLQQLIVLSSKTKDGRPNLIDCFTHKFITL